MEQCLEAWAPLLSAGLYKGKIKSIVYSTESHVEKH